MIKNFIKKVIPPGFMQWRRRKIVSKWQRKFATKTVAETFSEIYEKNVWGGDKGVFYSGEGSTDKYAEAYAKTIKKFIVEKNVKTVIDLGCGDFRVASKIVSDDFYYTGCDIVPSLVEYLNDKFARNNIEFRCINIIEDQLPDGDLCLIRQVLQHLSNAEIEQILQKARKYKFLIVTEHYPSPKIVVEPNLNIPHGPDMRLHFNSAVYLDKPPFNLQNIKLLLDMDAEEETRIKTFCIEF